MATLYWNPQVNPFTPTSDDDVVLSWGTAHFDTLSAKTLTVEGGVTATIGYTTITKLVIGNGASVTLTAEQTISFTSIEVEGGATLCIAGAVTTESLIIGNGVCVYMDGGLTADKFSIEGGSYLKVSGYMSISGYEIKAEGDVSYIWDSETQSGSTVIHDHGTDACFLAGTDILTPVGMCPVEELCVGDYVITRNEKMQAIPKQIVWTGQGRHKVDPRYAKGYSDVSGVPVCIRADVFAPGVPYRDLYVTPEHMVLVNGDKLIPVRMLVDGLSIYYVNGNTEYDYYHFCFEDHEIVTANGLLTESYLASGQEFSVNTQGTLPENMNVCRSIVTDPEKIRQIRQALKCKADAAEYTPVLDESAVDLRAPGFVSAFLKGPDNHQITPLRKTDKSVTFNLVPGIGMAFYFNTTRPCDTDPSVDDRREMGPAVDIVGITGRGEIVPMEDLNLTGMVDADHPSECVVLNAGSAATQIVVSLKA